MGKEKKYPVIKPKKKKIKTLVIKIMFYFIGYGFQTLYRVDPEIKKEIDRWPDTFIFLLQVIGGPRLVIEKRNGKVLYRGEREIFFADIELNFKNIEFAYRTVIGLSSMPAAAYENRQFIKGDLNIMMSIIRIINQIISTAFPKFLAKIYIKRVPRLTMRRVMARFAFYFNVAAGMIK